MCQRVLQGCALFFSTLLGESPNFATGSISYLAITVFDSWSDRREWYDRVKRMESCKVWPGCIRQLE